MRVSFSFLLRKGGHVYRPVATAGVRHLRVRLLLRKCLCLNDTVKKNSETFLREIVCIVHCPVTPAGVRHLRVCFGVFFLIDIYILKKSKRFIFSIFYYRVYFIMDLLVLVDL